MVGFSRFASADEDRTLARLRALRSDPIDPTIAVHHGTASSLTPILDHPGNVGPNDRSGSSLLKIK